MQILNSASYNFNFSLAYVLPFLRVCDEICARFGEGAMQKHAVKKGSVLLFLGTIGFILECVSAMEYYQGKYESSQYNNALRQKPY